MKFFHVIPNILIQSGSWNKGVCAPLDFQKIHSYPPIGRREVKFYGWVGVVQRYMLTHFYPHQSIFSHQLNLVNFQKNKNSQIPPFLEGGVKIVMRGAGGTRVCARKKNLNQSIFTCPFNYNKISPPYTPPWGAPGEPVYIRNPKFFMAHMIVDTLRIPNLPKSIFHRQSP